MTDPVVTYPPQPLTPEQVQRIAAVLRPHLAGRLAPAASEKHTA